LAIVGGAGALPGTAAEAALVFAPCQQLNYCDGLPSATLSSEQVVVMTTAEAELAALANRSPLGRKLFELRRRVLATGVAPLNWDGVRAEVQAGRNDI
jgi:hypothetical protein